MIIINVATRYILPTRLQREIAMIIINVTTRYIKLGRSWEDPIPDDIKIKWKKWRADLLNWQQISISRC